MFHPGKSKGKNLTLKSWGLLSMILSTPDEWNLHHAWALAAVCKKSVDSIGTALKGLETADCISPKRKRRQIWVIQIRLFRIWLSRTWLSHIWKSPHNKILKY